ncbi:MAG TPA: replication-associated recombination protein A [Solirubrobacteraceae bacterium]|jgi:putative ATPase|nr:replication-associated recombination protein A [Solirubrobacteraceae bacterium]
MESLFDPAEAPPSAHHVAEDAPLAARMRPASLEEFVGQEHLLGAGSALRTAIEQGRPHSMILHGPPGSGKTTLARIVAAGANAAFEELSAVEAGRAEVRAVLARARERQLADRRTIFFLDEIHRFNKAQQDALLPAVEEGLVTLIGATTENPSFEVNRALLSRTRLYELSELTENDVLVLLRRALQRGECDRSTIDTGIGGPPTRARGGIADQPAQVQPEAIELLAARSLGDARMALSALELACETADGSVTVEHAEDALQRRIVHYDKQADSHYDTISAWIKATRGSDPDASLYYLAVMLEGGEDPRFVARRMVILASEDIGNADPQALVVASAAAAAVEHAGLPECQFALAQAALYLSLAPKSDAAKRAIGAARQFVRDHGAAPPPVQLRSGGRGEGYDSPHAHPGHVTAQELAPDETIGERFYAPDAAEAALAERLAAIRRARGRE